MNNFSMVRKRADESIVSNDYDCCADLINWYAACTGRMVVEAEIHVISDDGRKLAITGPVNRNAHVRVKVQAEKPRHDVCAF